MNYVTSTLPAVREELCRVPNQGETDIPEAVCPVSKQMQYCCGIICIPVSIGNRQHDFIHCHNEVSELARPEQTSLELLKGKLLNLPDRLPQF